MGGPRKLRFFTSKNGKNSSLIIHYVEEAEEKRYSCTSLLKV
jgi:hypothetical protein